MFLTITIVKNKTTNKLKDTSIKGTYCFSIADNTDLQEKISGNLRYLWETLGGNTKNSKKMLL